MERSVVVIACLALAGCARIFGLDDPRLLDAAAGGGPVPSSDAAHDAVTNSNCPPGYTTAGMGIAYKFVMASKPWVEAEKACASDQVSGSARHTHLVVLTSDTQRGSLSAFGGGAEVWIGLSDRRIEGTFLWVTDEQVAGGYPPATAWKVGEPTGSTTQNCVSMAGGGDLFDNDCALARGYICECDGYAENMQNY